MKPRTMADQAQDPGKDEPRVGELENETEEAEGDEDRSQGRIGEEVEEVLPGRHVGVDLRGIDDALVGRGRSLAERRLLAFEDVEELVEVVGHEVNDALVHGIGLVGGDGFADRLFSPVLVAATQFGDAANEGDGIVLDLLAEGAADVAAIGVDSSGSADRGVGRHRGDVGRHRDERAGARGVGPGGHT